MLKLLFFSLFALQIMILCSGQRYSSRYDNLDIEGILKNRRVLKNYVKCLLGEGACTAEGRELRDHLPEALETNCAKCTDAQKRFVRRGAKFLMQNEPQEWAKITKKYDPQGQFTPRFGKFLNEQS